MLRRGIVGFGLLLGGTVFAQASALSLACSPIPGPTVSSGSDPVVRSTVVYDSGRWSILHFLQSGTIIDRRGQYSLLDTSTPSLISWEGVLHLRPNIAMKGYLLQAGGSIIYQEVIYDAKRGRDPVAIIRNNCAFMAAHQPALDASAALQAEADRQATANAVAARIDAENKLRTAQAEKVALLEKSANVVRDRLFQCVAQEAAPMLLTDETSEVVAKSAIVLCNQDSQAFEQIVIEETQAKGGSSGERGPLREYAEKALQDLVTAHVVKARGEMRMKQQAPNSTTPSGPPA
jgi:hypothetical protein